MDDNCAEYGIIDKNHKWTASWEEGCKKVCKECKDNYYLTQSYDCVALPPYCEAVDDYGVCKDC